MVDRLCLLCLMLSILYGCGSETPAGTNIPFSSVIDFSAWEGTFAGQYTESKPMCLLEASENTDNDLTSIVNPHVRKQIQAKQQPEMLMLACFLGLRSQGGEAIAIRNLTIQSQTLFIEAEFIFPAQDTFVESGTHSPVSIIQLEQALIPRNTPLTLQLIDVTTNQKLASNSAVFP